ncbi:MAG TPA: thioredoxin fold domain-containing protein [Thermodesulfovibrionales bacterium]|nr:thioredoxin fold domain-containing protein [Thermodesulfovibrionales bacterium]
MKQIILLVSLVFIAFVNVSCSKPDYKKITTDFIASSAQVKDYAIREVADTTSPDWKAVVVYVKEGAAKMPVLIFISSDGKSIVPNSMVYVNNKPIFTKQLEPELGRIGFKLTEKDRIVYNPSGKQTVFMFFDPDCPYCKAAMEKIRSYTGEYRVIVKFFPLEQIHPGATQKAVQQQAEWLKKNRKDLTREVDILREATRMVEEDITEAQKAELTGVPIYVMADGTLKQGLF